MEAIGADTRIGSKYLSHGFGYGGPCLPRDIDALIAYLSKMKIDNNIFKDIKQYNKIHRVLYAEYLINKNDGGVINMECISYKKGIDLFDNSEQFETIKYIVSKGYKVKIKNSTKGQREFITKNHKGLISSITFET